MTWDKDRPKGTQPFNVGDEAIAANFDWLEEALGVGGTFPGTTTTRGRKKGASDSVANADGMSGLVDGNEIHVNDLGGGSQQDGDGATTHFWPHRYSAAGGGAQLSAWVPMTPPVCDDDTEQGTLEGKLGTDDFGLIAYRLVGTVPVPMLWDGSAFQLIGRSVVVEDEVSVDADTDTADAYDQGSEGGPFSGWDLLESSGSGDEFHLTLAVPDATGLTLRLTLGWSFVVVADNGTWNGFGITEDIDAAGEADLFGMNSYSPTGGAVNTRDVFRSGTYTKTFTNASAVDYEYRIKARAQGSSPATTVLTISPDNAENGLNVADTNSHFWVRIEVVGIT